MSCRRTAQELLKNCSRTAQESCSNLRVFFSFSLEVMSQKGEAKRGAQHATGASPNAKEPRMDGRDEDSDDDEMEEVPP
eukprot:8742034-Karenia_brevis.AAC.1